MMIQQLESDVISQLRSGVALTSISQCVEELVLNSLDAGASCITVDLDISSRSVEVRDNGTGLCQNDLRILGKRYCTSKCQNIKELENVRSYGFRGEAIASLAKTCEKLEIISRQKTSYRTYCKLVQSGKDMGVYERSTPLSRPGTTVLAHGLFHTLPVRRKMVSSSTDLECTRRQMVAIAIIHPKLSLILRNKVNGCVYLNTIPSTSILSTIAQFFGTNQSKDLKPINHTHGVFKISGYVNLSEQQNKGFQFVFINKRLVLKTKLHKIVNNILSKRISKSQSDSVGCESTAQHVGFLINVECPPHSYDITFDPAKTLVEFKTWLEPLTALRDCLSNFLQKEGFVMPDMFLDGVLQTRINTEDSSDGISESESDGVSSRTISSSNVRWSLHSSTAKRKLACLAGNDLKQKCVRSSLRSTPGVNIGIMKKDSDSNDATGILNATSNSNFNVKSASYCTTPSFQGTRHLTILKDDASQCNLFTERVSLESSSSSRHNSGDIDGGFSGVCDVDGIGQGNVQGEGGAGWYNFGVGLNVGSSDGVDGVSSSEWLSHYDPIHGKKLYVNLRSGNTSEALPTCTSELIEKKIEKTRRELHPFARHLSHNFTPWLPRNENTIEKGDRRPLTQNNKHSKMDSMLKNWTNPVFQTSLKIMDRSLSAVKKMSSTRVPQTFNFTKECLQHMEVIKQVDNKFIVCCLKTGNGADAGSLLVVVDQHAADERVRLEKFTQDIYKIPSDVTINKPVYIKSSSLSVPCKLSFPKHVVDSMKFYQTQLHHVGVSFEEQRPSLGNKHEQYVIINAVPSIFLDRNQFREETDSFCSDSLENNTQSLIKEQLEVLHSTRGASTSLPSTIVRILNSQACHGAIRFGDPLSLVQCHQLMSSLSKCDLPFQCAHGRPSMVPLISLNPTKHEMTKTKIEPVRVWKLKKRMKQASKTTQQSKHTNSPRDLTIIT